MRLLTFVTTFVKCNWWSMIPFMTWAPQMQMWCSLSAHQNAVLGTTCKGYAGSCLPVFATDCKLFNGQVFAPLARLLGLYSIKEELEELSFRFSEPENAARLAAQLTTMRATQVTN